MPRHRHDEEHARDTAVTNLELEATNQSLCIGGMRLRLDAVRPCPAPNEPVPRTKVADDGQRNLYSPTEASMQSVPKSSKEDSVAGVAQWAPTWKCSGREVQSDHRQHGRDANDAKVSGPPRLDTTGHRRCDSDRPPHHCQGQTTIAQEARKATGLDPSTVEKVVQFQGHMCPGLAMGIHAAEIALREIGPHSPHEEVGTVRTAAGSGRSRRAERRASAGR